MKRPVAAGGVALLLLGALPILGSLTREERRYPAERPLGKQEECVSCHAGVGPGVVAQWMAGKHFAAGVSCEACHGTDHTQMFNAGPDVSRAVCGACHRKALEGFARSRHAIPVPDTEKRNAALTAHAAQVGNCTVTAGCHDIQRPFRDGTVGRCASCHPGHGTDLTLSRDPRLCQRCHQGPDHPQYEAWSHSMHGLMWQGGDRSAPTCVSCHMPSGQHDDGIGVIRGVNPQGISGLTLTRSVPLDEIRPAREEMVRRCLPCHGRARAESELTKADRIRQNGAVMIEEAARTVERLHALGLLTPMPEDRPAHPLAGKTLVLGPRQLFEEHSSPAERRFYKMLMFTYPGLWRAAYHGQPEVLLWEGNERMKEDLIFIRNERARAEGRPIPKSAVGTPQTEQR